VKLSQISDKHWDYLRTGQVNSKHGKRPRIIWPFILRIKESSRYLMEWLKTTATGKFLLKNAGDSSWLILWLLSCSKTMLILSLLKRSPLCTSWLIYGQGIVQDLILDSSNQLMILLRNYVTKLLRNSWFLRMNSTKFGSRIRI